MSGNITDLIQRLIVSNRMENLDCFQISFLQVSNLADWQNWPVKGLRRGIWGNSNVIIHSQIRLSQPLVYRQDKGDIRQILADRLKVLLPHHPNSRNLHQVLVALAIEGQNLNGNRISLNLKIQFTTQKGTDFRLVTGLQKGVGCIEIVVVHDAQISISQFFATRHIFFNG